KPCKTLSQDRTINNRQAEPCPQANPGVSQLLARCRPNCTMNLHRPCTIPPCRCQRTASSCADLEPCLVAPRFRRPRRPLHSPLRSNPAPLTAVRDGAVKPPSHHNKNSRVSR